MEGITVSVCKGVKEFWRKRGYQRLDGSGRRRRTTRVELGATTRNRKTRFWGWRMTVAPKIRIRRIPSPKKMVVWLRDAYVRMMVDLANSRVVTMSASATGFGGPNSWLMGGLGRAHPKEYDEKVIVQIYKSLLMAHGQLLSNETSRIASEISSGSHSSIAMGK